MENLMLGLHYISTLYSFHTFSSTDVPLGKSNQKSVFSEIIFFWGRKGSSLLKRKCSRLKKRYVSFPSSFYFGHRCCSQPPPPSSFFVYHRFYLVLLRSSRVPPIFFCFLDFLSDIYLDTHHTLFPFKFK